MKDTGYAPSKWAFDEEVTRVFENMLERSIPQLAVMRSLVHDIAMRSLHGTEGAVVDIGCSQGGALASLVEARKERRRFVGLEVSEPMLKVARERFKDDHRVGIVRHDLRSGRIATQGHPPALVLSVLTLMFVPIEHRQAVVRDIASKLRGRGGRLILVEKVLGSTSANQKLLTDIYHAQKLAMGYSQEDVQRKALSLEGVLVPMTARWNEELLHSEGFTDIECFWRWGPFAAWVASA